MAAFPNSVATNLNVLVAVDQFSTTLTSAINSAVTAIPVASSSRAQVGMVITIDSEDMQVTAVAPGELTVTRGFDGTTPAGHNAGRSVRCLIDQIYHGRLATEIKAIEAALGAHLRYVSSGVVLMKHNEDGDWLVLKPDGTPLDVSNTTTQGLQEAITYAQQNACTLVVYGGGVTPPSVGVPPSTALSRIYCTTPIAIPTGWGNCYHFIGADLYYNVAGGANAALDFISIDSSDYTEIDFHHSQIIYPGNAAAIRFNPTANNGEAFAGFTSSTFRLPTIAIVNPSTLAPESSHGTGVRISCPALPLGLANGNGICIENKFYIAEINGGAVGVQIDDPAATTSPFRDNTIESPAIHACAIGVKVGTSATSGSGGRRVYGNRFYLTISATTTNVEIWGQENSFDMAIAGGTNGIILGSSMDGANIRLAQNLSATPLTDNSTSHNYRYEIAVAPVRVVVAVGASPYVYQNTTGRTMFAFVSGGTVSAIAVSADGVTYDSASSPPTNSYYTLLPGMYLKITHTGAPNMFVYY